MVIFPFLSLGVIVAGLIAHKKKKACTGQTFFFVMG
jgi:hypothetical protein